MKGLEVGCSSADQKAFDRALETCTPVAMADKAGAEISIFAVSG
jgi:hypothetical protein